MIDWENLRYLLAVAHTGSLSGAARHLGVDHATVSRRLAGLEEQVEVRLLERLPRACRLTPIGQRVVELAQGMEESAYAIERLIDASRSPLSGTVTLSAPPVLVANFLAGRLASFRQQNPAVRISVSSETRKVSLARREADVILRLSRPEEPSSVVRKIGRMPFGLYASRQYIHLHHPPAWEFITYNEGFADVPRRQWLARFQGERASACEINDVNGHLTAAQAGAGVAGLPVFIGDTDARLQRVAPDAEPFSCDIWIAVHRDLRRTPPVRAVMDFIAKIVADHPGLESLPNKRV
ncbi:LysR family transcriptional regulator [Pararobbsia silviterrae]|uniref:LysR family transcriptional regulator n=1 Tax=Pararobbsia silviterrae TaxID=1792498 RepID=A0A494XB62_9BURK|nr:LysR family transcriptional regulator [Pararobbsia silviterrae]RKP47780.1 LysR family transcriptional regulator [Pararobbsia silviterrae]